MNRGSDNTQTRAARFEKGFNEAPIHESGKYCNHLGGQRSESSFNEAPIHESGKSSRARLDGVDMDMLQ